MLTRTNWIPCFFYHSLATPMDPEGGLAESQFGVVGIELKRVVTEVQPLLCELARVLTLSLPQLQAEAKRCRGPQKRVGESSRVKADLQVELVSHFVASNSFIAADLSAPTQTCSVETQTDRAGPSASTPLAPFPSQPRRSPAAATPRCVLCMCTISCVRV